MSKESVWDYPRPPRAEHTSKRIRVYFGGELVADTNRAIRILETSHPPVYYIRREDVRSEYLKLSPRRSFCEFKGSASYWSLEVDGKISEDAAWSYEHPERDYELIRGCFAFYASKADECLVDEERVQPQPGSFYGGLGDVRPRWTLQGWPRVGRVVVERNRALAQSARRWEFVGLSADD